MIFGNKGVYDIYGKSFLHDEKIGYRRFNKTHKTYPENFVFREMSWMLPDEGGWTPPIYVEPKITNLLVTNVTHNSAQFTFTIAKVSSVTRNYGASVYYKYIDKDAPMLYNIGTTPQHGIRIFYSTTPTFAANTVGVKILSKRDVDYNTGDYLGYETTYSNISLSLSPSTKYYYYVRIDYYEFSIYDGNPNIKGSIQTGFDSSGTYPSFTTTSVPVSTTAPVVETSSISGITTTNAVVNAKVTTAGGENIQNDEYGYGIVFSVQATDLQDQSLVNEDQEEDWIVDYTPDPNVGQWHSSYASRRTIKNIIRQKITTGDYQYYFSDTKPWVSTGNLLPNTTYYVRAYARNSKGIAYGNTIQFTTLKPAPTPGKVLTEQIISIGTNNATVALKITEFGNNPVTEYGFIYTKADLYNNIYFSPLQIYSYYPANKISVILNTTDSDSLYATQTPVTKSINITGLSQNTLYYVRAFIKDLSGISFGFVSNFTTVIPILTTYPDPGIGVDWFQPYKNWIYGTPLDFFFRSQNGLSISGLALKNMEHPISYYLNATFSSEKNYQFRTSVSNFYDTAYIPSISSTNTNPELKGYLGGGNSTGFSIRTPWGETFSYPVPYIHSDNVKNMSNINLYYYATLSEEDYTLRSSMTTNTTNAQNPITYLANGWFGRSYALDPDAVSSMTLTQISSSGLAYGSTNTNNNLEFLNASYTNELSWKIQGFSFYTLGIEELFIKLPDYAGKGWHYNATSKKFTWFDRYSATAPITGIKPYYGSTTTITINENDKNNPVGGPVSSKISHRTYRKNNYIAQYIPYQKFNISFTYKCDIVDKGVKIYLSQTLPTDGATDSNIIMPDYSTRIASLTKSTNGEQKIEFFGLEGNQYLYIVGDTVGETSSTYSICEISNVSISGGYHSGNNQKYTISSTSSSFNTNSILINGTYSISVGIGNTLGGDLQGIRQIVGKIGNGNFKSGVWENGIWNNGWREDKEVRDFYKIDKFTSYDRDTKWQIYISGPESSVNASDANNTLLFSVGDRVSISNIVAIDINENRKLLTKYFRIIERSSEYLVVEFENEFPLRRIEIDSAEHRIKITKNVWLSGTFFNGYFTGVWNKGLFAGYPFLTKMENAHWVDGIFSGGHFRAEKYKIPFSKTILSSYLNNRQLGLTFSRPHKLATGDIINIINTGDVETGETIIVSVPNEYSFITGLSWKEDYSSITGTVYSLISSGLIQNFEFYAKNVSKNTSAQSLNRKNVFVYNSWIDVNYSDKSAVNIGKPQSLLNEISNKGYSENNLYGYPTTDVLSSNSFFRDSFSNTVRDYKLGTKYKIFGDYVGDSSKFEEYFESTDTVAGRDKFTQQGWEFSKSAAGLATFSRTPEPIDSSTTTIGKELRVFAGGKGGVLNLTPAYDVNNRINGEVEKLRYTLVEFEILTYLSNTNYKYYQENGFVEPPIHFGNLNYITRIENGVKTKQTATYLPIYENINHLNTGDSKKQEFFFNKRNLLMNFRGLGNAGTYAAEYYIDNLKLYEVDMIPFFEYFKNDNINRAIQNPYEVTSAPEIDYNENDEAADPQILNEYIDAGNISAVNGINWVEDIILKRHQE